MTGTPTTTSSTPRVHDIQQHKFSVAPMMEYTDCYQRQLQRFITNEAVLYTEMVAANALTRSDNPMRFLRSNFQVQEPLVLQLGGADPVQMKAAAKIAYTAGYREINLNVGCPSDKVSGSGCFGAALMASPKLVGALAVAIGEELGRPATVKCRIGINDNESYEGLCEFITIVHEIGGVTHFIIHARKAVLGAKFSPEDNRKIPPLKYDYVYRLVKDFPHLHFTINGGILTMEDALTHLQHGVAGVMVGRSIVNTPHIWRSIDSQIYKKNDPAVSRRTILEKYALYAQEMEDLEGPRIRHALIKPILNLFVSEPGGRLFRRRIDELMRTTSSSSSFSSSSSLSSSPPSSLSSISDSSTTTTTTTTVTMKKTSTTTPTSMKYKNVLPIGEVITRSAEVLQDSVLDSL